jgi:hypothetical protein
VHGGVTRVEQLSSMFVKMKLSRLTSPASSAFRHTSDLFDHLACIPEFPAPFWKGESPEYANTTYAEVCQGSWIVQDA